MPTRQHQKGQLPCLRAKARTRLTTPGCGPCCRCCWPPRWPSRCSMLMPSMETSPPHLLAAGIRAFRSTLARVHFGCLRDKHRPAASRLRLGHVAAHHMGALSGRLERSSPVRALSLFIGLLTLAWVYRVRPRPSLAPSCRTLIAALLLSASVFLSRLHDPRAQNFMRRLPSAARYLCLVLTGASPCIRSQPGRGTQAGLLLGSIWSALFTLSSVRCCCPSSDCFIFFSRRSTGAGCVRCSFSDVAAY